MECDGVVLAWSACVLECAAMNNDNNGNNTTKSFAHLFGFLSFSGTYLSGPADELRWSPVLLLPMRYVLFIVFLRPHPLHLISNKYTMRFEAAKWQTNRCTSIHSTCSYLESTHLTICHLILFKRCPAAGNGPEFELWLPQECRWKMETNTLAC